MSDALPLPEADAASLAPDASGDGVDEVLTAGLAELGLESDFATSLATCAASHPAGKQAVDVAAELTLFLASSQGLRTSPPARPG